MATASGDWPVLVAALNMADAAVGKRISSSDAPTLAGTVEHHGERELLLKLDARPGSRARAAYDWERSTHASTLLYLFEESSYVAARESALTRLDGCTLGGVSDFELPITTALELPGHKVRENLGIVFGLVVRSVGLKGGATAAIRSLKKGEVTEYTELLEDARRHAIDRMVANAKLLEANGIVSMRFDSSEMGSGLTEVVAYGTAVVVARAG